MVFQLNRVSYANGGDLARGIAYDEAPPECVAIDEAFIHDNPGRIFSSPWTFSGLNLNLRICFRERLVEKALYEQPPRG